MRQYLTNTNSWADPEADLSGIATRIHIEDSGPAQKACGCVVYGTPEESWVLDNDVHTLVVGKTSSGKSVSCMAPTIASIINRGESAIIYDQKGEFRREFRNYAKKKGYQVICLDFGGENSEAGWNPFEIAMKLYKEGNQAMSDTIINDIASAVYAKLEDNCKDMFWTQTAATYLSGLAKILRKEHGRIDFDLISRMSRAGDEKIGIYTAMKQYMEYLDENNLEDQRILQEISPTVQAPNDTRASILAVFRQPFHYLCNDNISRLLYKSSFDMRTIGTRKTIVFISSPACSSDTDMLVSMFVRQLYTVLVDLVAQKQANRRLPIRVNMVLDEFSSLPAVKDFSNRMISLARGFNIRFFLALQSIAQLYARYSTEEADNILVNCGAIIIFNTKDTRVHDLVKALCGTRQTYYAH